MEKERIKSLLLNNKFEHTDMEKVNILAEINDKEFIMTFLERKKLGNSSVIELLKILDNPELIKECIRSKKIKLGIDDKYLLALRIGDSDFIINDRETSKVNLPRDLSFGIEIESEGENSYFILSEFAYEGWRAKKDYSLENGVEVTSPILNSDDKNIKQIYMVNEVMKKMGHDATEKCAAHIHFGADFLKSKQSFVNLMEIWHNSDKIIYAVSNKLGEVPRPQILNYAAPISNEIMKVLEEGTVTLEDEDDLHDFMYNLKALQAIAVGEKTGGKGRNSGLNLLNVHSVKNTVEFRVPNGTLDPEVWIDNINLYGRIMVVAQELAEIQEKSGLKFTERKQLELFNRLKSNLDETLRAEILFELIGVDYQKYMNKYYTNIKLFNKSPWMKVVFEEREIVDLSLTKVDVMMDEIGEIAATSDAISQLEAQEKIIESYQKNKEINIYVSK